MDERYTIVIACMLNYFTMLADRRWLVLIHSLASFSEQSKPLQVFAVMGYAGLSFNIIIRYAITNRLFGATVGS